MFDKDLFFSLCEKYNVELSETADKPMIKDAAGIHVVTDKDVNAFFTPCQTYFEYSSNKIDAKIISKTYYLQENFAIAC